MKGEAPRHGHGRERGDASCVVRIGDGDEGYYENDVTLGWVTPGSTGGPYIIADD